MKEWMRRAIRTFFQTAVGYLLVAVPALDFSEGEKLKPALIGIGVSAVAAGLAAVMNIREGGEDA